MAAMLAAAITHYSLRFNKFTFPVYAKHNNNQKKKNDERNNLQLFIVIFMHHWVRAHCTIVCASLFSWFYIAECWTLFWCCNLLNWRVFVIWFVFMRKAVQTAISTQCSIHFNSSIGASTHKTNAANALVKYFAGQSNRKQQQLIAFVCRTKGACPIHPIIRTDHRWLKQPKKITI